MARLLPTVVVVLGAEGLYGDSAPAPTLAEAAEAVLMRAGRVPRREVLRVMGALLVPVPAVVEVGTLEAEALRTPAVAVAVGRGASSDLRRSRLARRMDAVRAKFSRCGAVPAAAAAAVLLLAAGPAFAAANKRVAAPAPAAAAVLPVEGFSGAGATAAAGGGEVVEVARFGGADGKKLDTSEGFLISLTGSGSSSGSSSGSGFGSRAGDREFFLELVFAGASPAPTADTVASGDFRDTVAELGGRSEPLTGSADFLPAVPAAAAAVVVVVVVVVGTAAEAGEALRDEGAAGDDFRDDVRDDDGAGPSRRMRGRDLTFLTGVNE